VYFSKKDYDKAISNLNEAIRLEPKYADTYYWRGTAYFLKGNYDKAVSDLSEVIRLEPEVAEAYYWRGNAYGQKGDHDKAISEFTQAIRLNPNYAEAYYGRGGAYHSKGDYNKAIADYKSALRIEPNNSDVKKILELAQKSLESKTAADAYIVRGNAYGKKGDHDKAIYELTQAIQLEPDNANAYYNRGLVYSYKKNYDKAISDYTESIRLNPNYASAYHNRGNTYYNKGDYDKAIADFKSALRIDPNHSNAKKGLELAKKSLENKNAPPPVACNSSYGVFTDNRDGKKYKAVRIGRQTWMAENLNYAASGSKCYENNSGNCAKYGRLYDWTTAKNVCPSGWHLPSAAEWNVLTAAVDGHETAGKKLKAKSGWNSFQGKSGNGTDEFGFSALPGGLGGSDGDFVLVGGSGLWWSANEYDSYRAYRWFMVCSDIAVGRNYHSKSDLYSVRCVQD
jgi:uncharacterized protein (TIGR02145 family)